MGFAACIAAVAFLLALYAAGTGLSDSSELTKAGIIAAACGILSWGAADRLLALMAASVNAAVSRLEAATAGDLASPTPDAVATSLPELSHTLDELLEKVRSNIESANTLAMFDSVTALSNRLHFRNETETVLAGMSARSRAALYFVDLDNFKSVNDTLGHAAGDQLLIMIANRLRAIVPPMIKGSPSILGRLAGDEFTIFLPEVKNDAAAAEFGEQLLNALREPFSLHGQQVRVGASIGIALRPQHGAGLTDLMRAADVAMYQAKQKGRDRYEFYSDALAERLSERTKLDQELREAFAKKQFVYEFQPQILLADRRVVAVEALMRWHHPVDGMRQPWQFMRVAEESGLMADLSDWALESAAAAIGRWHRAGHSQRLAVNLSKRQFERGAIFQRASDAMERHAAPLDMLELEISDGLANEASEAIVRELAALREDGATISIDNFAKSPINITRLRALPVDRVKIDRSLIGEIAQSAESRAVMQAAVTMLHALGKETVAQGVETEEQIEVLRVMGCQAAQGYAIARPAGEASLHKFLSETAPATRKRA